MPWPATTTWSVSLGAGYFMPAIDGWSDQYGSAGELVPDFGVKYAFTSILSVAAEVGYFSAKSLVKSETGRTSGVHQNLVMWPGTLGLEARYRVSAEQLFTPSLSVGYRRVLYRLSVDGQDTVGGGAGGLALGLGVDVLLNDLDPQSAEEFRADYGIERTCLRLEAQWATIQAPGTNGDVDLGGVTYLAAFKFDF